MRIGLLGFGVVGRGVYDITANRDDMQVVRVLCLEDVTLTVVQHSIVFLIEMLQHTAEQEKEQLLFVSEILVEAASGDSCAGYDFIDGRIGIGNIGKFLPCSIQKPVLLLFGKAKERFRTHGEPSLSINDSLSYDRLSLIITEERKKSMRR